MNPKDLLRQAHMKGSAAPPEVKPVQVEVQKEEPKKVTVEIANTIEKPTESIDKNIPTAIRQVKHPKVPLEEYGVQPDITTFQLYNYDLSEFLTSFSKRNKKNGGHSITKSQLMETVLNFAVYDLGLKPEGYKNAQELLRDLQNKIKN